VSARAHLCLCFSKQLAFESVDWGRPGITWHGWVPFNQMRTHLEQKTGWTAAQYPCLHPSPGRLHCTGLACSGRSHVLDVCLSSAALVPAQGLDRVWFIHSCQLFTCLSLETKKGFLPCFLYPLPFTDPNSKNRWRKCLVKKMLPLWFGIYGWGFRCKDYPRTFFLEL
jgi:hypothetical protein